MRPTHCSLRSLLAVLLIACLSLPALADEGMWIPMLLQRNEADMQAKGMHISAKDIYDINNACLKDAVILFNQGCTGEFVSPEGLFLTNHHCGYYYITSHSTVAHDYLTRGFWAMTREEELPCPGLTATRLVRMEDVTAQVLEGVSADASELERSQLIDEHIAYIISQATQGTHYRAIVKPFYYGNQYFMYVNEVFTDVRLVGAPPSNIGKFGGDTDNWMWPRHTGDFSMFRVYVNREGKPAPYSTDNVPYQPKKHLEISLKGVQEGDFTFVFGYPGTTHRYVTSDAVDLAANVQNPICIDLRTIRLKHYNNAMNRNAALRLKYASRVASIANGWKKWQGESQGIARLKGVEQKQEQERLFQRWADNNNEYRDVLTKLHNAYTQLRPLQERAVYFSEGVHASDFMGTAAKLFQLATTPDSLAQRHADETSYAYEPTDVDSAIFIETMRYVMKHNPQWGFAVAHPTEAQATEELQRIYHSSRILNKASLDSVKQHVAQCDQWLNDPAVDLYSSALDYAFTADQQHERRRLNVDINRLMRTYVRGLMAMYPDSNFFPDANLTLRVAYGHVSGFHPRDGVYYKPYSTLDGILQKENPDIYDYVVEPKLKSLHYRRDYAPYADENGAMPVGFIATNHTTGGNSGSPVLDADGRLIGINFDRCWEGTMSDLLFDPDYCRNICLDIRYCLFIIDKFADAKHLVDEMTLIQ
ncbi:MAG: S46 family peptidase [Bacteroidales bacterium]|nr:S46 family peptidase [Bacteroidales bacterium]